MDVTIGTDPEFFLRRKGTINGFVSAHDIVPGTKQEPHKLKNGAVQHDGVSVEFNIDPASTSKEFVNNITSVLSQIREMVPDDLEFVFAPAVEFDRKYFNSLPEKVRELGCDPDYDAHSGMAATTPARTKERPTLCTGSGHIHIGWTKDAPVADMTHFNDARLIAEAFYRVMSVVKAHWDKDSLRNTLYGGRGQFRPKPYGVESRFLSNAWLNYPELWPYIFNAAVGTVNTLDRDGQVYAPSYYTFSDSHAKAVHKQYREYALLPPFPFSAVKADKKKEGITWASK